MPVWAPPRRLISCRISEIVTGGREMKDLPVWGSTMHRSYVNASSKPGIDKEIAVISDLPGRVPVDMKLIKNCSCRTPPKPTFGSGQNHASSTSLRLGPTFDTSASRRQAKPAGGCPLDGLGLPCAGGRACDFISYLRQVTLGVFRCFGIAQRF